MSRVLQGLRVELKGSGDIANGRKDENERSSQGLERALILLGHSPDPPPPSSLLHFSLPSVNPFPLIPPIISLHVYMPPSPSAGQRTDPSA